MTTEERGSSTANGKRTRCNGIQQTVAWVGDLLYYLRRTFGDYKNPLAACYDCAGANRRLAA